MINRLISSLQPVKQQVSLILQKEALENYNSGIY